MTTTTTMTRTTYALLVLFLLLVPLPGVLLASTRSQPGTLPRDFIKVEVEVYKNNELWLRDYADPVNAYWLETMIGSLVFPAIKYIYGYYSIDGHYLINGIPVTTAETLTLGGAGASNITNYGWIAIYPGTVIPLATAGAGSIPLVGSSRVLSISDEEYVSKVLLGIYRVDWCPLSQEIYMPIIGLAESLYYLGISIKSSSSLVNEVLIPMSYTFPYGSRISGSSYASIVLPIGLLESWLSIYRADGLLAIYGKSVQNQSCQYLVNLTDNLLKEFKGPIVALIGYSETGSSANINKVASQSVLYPSLGVMNGLPSITYPGSIGFPGIGVPSSGGTNEVIAQKGPVINGSVNSYPKVAYFSIEWKPYLPQIKDNRLAYIYDVAGMIASQFWSKYYPKEASLYQSYGGPSVVNSEVNPLPYSVFTLNTTGLSVRYDDIHHTYIIEIEASGRLPNTYPEYNAFALELLSPYLVLGGATLISSSDETGFYISPVIMTNVPPVAIDFPSRYLILYPGDEVKVVYRIKIRQDWPWTRNFYSYLIDYGIGVKWYYIAHNEPLPTLLQFVDKNGVYHDSLFNFTKQELPIPIPIIELSGEPITPQTLDVYVAYRLPKSIGSFEAQAATLVLYKNNDLIRIAATLGFEVSNITEATSLARSVGIYIAPYKDTSFLFAAIPIQDIKLVSESSRSINSNQYLYAMTIWLGVDLRGENQ